MSRRLRGAPLLALIAVIASAPAAEASKAIAAASVEIDVRWGGASGSDAFRDELRRAVAEDLATGCFASVTSTASPPAVAESDLILDVLLSDDREETEFDDSIAGVLQPGDPSQEVRRIARCSVRIDLALTARVSGAVVVRKHHTVTSARRPLYAGDDAQAGARADVIRNAVDRVSSSLGCGGSKLERKIREALAQGGAGAPRSR